MVGLIAKKPREWTEPQLRRMIEPLRHTPSYPTGAWIDESLGPYVGWTARWGSPSDRMSVRNERGDVLLVFSGEESPEPGIVDRLKDRGHAVDAEGPSYLVHIYEEDPSFPAGLNGWFHGPILGLVRGTVAAGLQS